ncbi:MAG: DNA replication and repair protein RecF [Bacteroidota bacterium]|nr:DNA replication and repair protein RecF [Bacteroidota bacterium]
MYIAVMLFVKRLSVTQFRNYAFESFLFQEPVVGIYGANGSGKTNLLDAVHYLCFTKSYFARTDALNAHYGTQGFRLEATLDKASHSFHIVCILRENNKKEITVNEETYKRFSAHIGKFPCVMIAPDDVELITGSSEERRRFVDTILSQLNADYLLTLIEYNKILQQRNSLLKAAVEHNRLDEDLLQIMDEQLSEKGNKIYAWRAEFMQEFLPLVRQEYNNIAGKDDEANVEYESPLHNSNLQTILHQNRQRDLYLQRTGSGIHKDDLEITMHQQAFKSIASQGQRKSLLFALKLAEFSVIQQHKGFAPFLLLDDVFEKLDADRMHNLLYKVCVQQQAQVFITDTHKERLEEAFEKLGVKCQLIGL